MQLSGGCINTASTGKDTDSKRDDAWSITTAGRRLMFQAFHTDLNVRSLMTVNKDL